MHAPLTRSNNEKQPPVVNMLDAFEIITSSGVVLWSRTYAPVAQKVVNNLINDVFIEERTQPLQGQSPNATFKTDKYTLKYTQAKDVGLIFVAVYQSILHLSWVDSLLDVVRRLFIKQYSPDLKKQTTTKLDCSAFSPTFDALVQKLDKTQPTEHAHLESDSPTDLTPSSSSAGDDLDQPPPPPAPALRKPAPRQLVDTISASADQTPIPTPDTSRPGSPAVSQLLQGKSPRGSRRTRKAALAASSAPASSGDEKSPARKSTPVKRPTAKSKRTWDAHGFGASEDEDTLLDYSTQSLDDAPVASTVQAVRTDDMGSRTAKGQFVLKDLDDEVDAILAESKSKKEQVDMDESKGLVGSGLGAISGYFRNMVGGKTLTAADLVKPLKAMEDHLLNKNVAREAAVRLCDSVERDLIGLKTSNFTTIDQTIRDSMSKALTRILTPTSSLDLLRSITATTTGSNARPYVISIVGVNGVGKSTSLSKLAFFFLQNNFRVLVCAADTFRSGAVEQLRVHVRNLSELTARENLGHVDLYEKGYGKDAAQLAKDAVIYAAEHAYDVVLVDTAGRRHNDTRLMSSLTKFGQLANPDKIFMVGEALVGTDSVAQARNFSAQFVDRQGKGRGLDGFVISKCDTVGDMVGTLVSMVHATGIPVVFLGVGQHYGDLRGLNVGWAVDKLMK
jgi:signal recognition particle receptor subunit alpha